MKKANLTTELLFLLITIVITSSVILYLVHTGMITVKADRQDVSLLNTEFLPMGRTGSLAITEFDFCTVVSDDFRCLIPKKSFDAGDQVHFRFVVETSTVQGGIQLVENYKLSNPEGTVLLDVNSRDNFVVESTTQGSKEEVVLKDYFVIGINEMSGEYTLELLLYNSLLDQQVRKTERFIVK